MRSGLPVRLFRTPCHGGHLPGSNDILMNHLFLSPEVVPVAILLMGGHLFLAYYYRERYLPMLKIK